MSEESQSRTQQSDDESKRIGVSMNLPFVVAVGLAIGGYAIAGLLGLAVALLALPAGYVLFLAWAWYWVDQ